MVTRLRRLLALATVALWCVVAVPSEAQEATGGAASSAPATSVAATTRIVQPGDTLMTLSREWFETLTAASEPVTLAQVLIGIHRENPQAFGRDMNELLVGATVRLPDAETLRRTPRRAALDEVRATLGIWTAPPTATPRNEASPRPSVSAPTNAAMPAQASSAAPTRTPVETPIQTPSDAAPEPVETLEARVARIEAELADKQQQLDALAAQQARVAARPLATTEGANGSDLLTGLLQAFGSVGLSPLGGMLALASFVIFLLVIAALALRRRRERASSDDSASAESPPRVDLLQRPAPGAPIAGATVPPPYGGSSGIGRLSIDADLSSDALEGDPPPLTDAGSLIDLAQAYLEMGQIDAARAELQRALELGDEAQRAEAQRLLETLPSP